MRKKNLLLQFNFEMNKKRNVPEQKDLETKKKNV